MNPARWRPGSFLALACAGAAADARGSPAADKSSFTLFDPVPRALMREMSTDRPDQTESPISVDAGHLQIEMDVFSFSRESGGGGRTEVWNVMPFNFKLGLTQQTDAQILFDGWIVEEARAAGRRRSRAEGWGDLSLRIKANLWGNDGGATALAIMPHVRFPTASGDLGSGDVEGGLIIPFGWNVTERMYIGAMTELDRVAGDGGHRWMWLNSVTVGCGLTDRLGGYVEWVAAAAGNGRRALQFDAGVTFAFTDNLQLDAGCNFGLSGPVPDFQPFAGLSIRF